MERRRQMVGRPGRMVRRAETGIVKHELPRIIFIDSGQRPGVGEQLYGIVLPEHALAPCYKHQGTVIVPVLHRELRAYIREEA